MPPELKNQTPNSKGQSAAQEECAVCANTVPVSQLNNMQRRCCQLRLCRSCFSSYLHTKLYAGVVRIQCPGHRCHTLVSDREVYAHLPNVESKRLYHKMLIDARNDPTCKTCPRCGHEIRVRREDLLAGGIAESGLQVECGECSLQWRFTCHAPWHTGVTCHFYRLGDEAFRKWTRRRDEVRGVNAQRCPLCQTYIQRISGCNRMECSQCGTRFCYDCGQLLGKDKASWITRLLFGYHRNRWALRGCSTFLLPDFPVLRAAARASFFTGKLLLMLVLGPVAFIAGVGFGSLLVWLGYKAAKAGEQRWRGWWAERSCTYPQPRRSASRCRHPKQQFSSHTPRQSSRYSRPDIRPAHGHDSSRYARGGARR